MAGLFAVGSSTTPFHRSADCCRFVNRRLRSRRLQLPQQRIGNGSTPLFSKSPGIGTSRTPIYASTSAGPLSAAFLVQGGSSADDATTSADAHEQNVSSTSSRAQSVHLQLETMHEVIPHTSVIPSNVMAASPACGENNSNTTTNATKTVQVVSFRDKRRNGRLWKALNTSGKKFLAFLEYRGIEASIDELETRQVALDDPFESTTLRNEWRELWKAERLLTDRTELLAVYPSDAEALDRAKKQGDAKDGLKASRRGGFGDHLHLYVDRLLGILNDEQGLFQRDTRHKLVEWLASTYGEDATQRLIADNLQARTEKKQLGEFKEFLEWFRSEFPYYYDRCSSCGASLKEDLAQKAKGSESLSLNDDNKDEVREEDHKDDQCFLGYIYPNPSELVGKASRTELYQCHKCRDYTRFPRFNSAFHVVNSRRGRCGEYSVLVYEILRALGHEVRWIVVRFPLSSVILGCRCNVHPSYSHHFCSTRIGPTMFGLRLM
jgi:hypothetical protein